MKYLCFILGVLLVGACSSRSYKDTLFCELDKEVQDTLLYINQQVLEHGYEAPSIIDFSGNCKSDVKFLSSWVISNQIEDTVNKISDIVNGKTWRKLVFVLISKDCECYAENDGAQLVVLVTDNAVNS